MTNKELREENNKPIDEDSETAKRVYAQSKRRMITAELTKLLYDNPEELRLYCKSLVDAAKSGNMTAAIEINNRLEGKIKEEVKIDLDVASYIPTQAEEIELSGMFSKQKAIDIVPEKVEDVEDSKDQIQ